ncbi:chloride channel protein [Leuconostoc gelidum subsp. gasicomitatum]|uniref:chloride channel protein n=1 Tax=Leuconostoc gasicomitatum TaxID=115778 RepID=UPI001CC75B2B|nr:chloride channel protein [Leuconostoc gasicomitatum]MBZ5985281.1 chloride channel protein [Leuconostoc gasicomitatum]
MIFDLLQKKDGQSNWHQLQNIVLAVSTVVLGVIVGLSSLLLSLFLEVIEHFFLHYEETAKFPAPVGAAPIDRLLSVAVGGVIAAVIWWFLRTKTTPTISIKRALAGERMPFWQTVIHVVTQIFYVGTGGSVGRELAPREAGALLAQKWEDLCDRYHVPKLAAEDKRLLITAAAGAGFAGIYIAPITGMFFSVEVLFKKLTLRTVGVSLTMSIIAMFVGSLVKGFKPYYILTDVKFSLVSFVFVLILAPLSGLAGSWFRKFFQWAEKHQTKDNHILWQLPVAAILTGIVAYFFPEIMGNGRSLAQLAINSHQLTMLVILVVGALLKGVVTVLTIRAGASGGTLTPSIAVGGALGAVLSLILAIWIPGMSIGQGAILGAGTLLAASQQAPFMAMFMLIEICHLESSALLPMGFGILIATAVSKKILSD